jgi:hypothetical protein
MSGEQQLWSCPECGVFYMVEVTGVIHSRHYGTRQIATFRRADTGATMMRCLCGKFLHWLFNGDGVAGLPGRAR